MNEKHFESSTSINPTVGPLTQAQRRIWLLDQLIGSAPELASQRFFKLSGALDVVALRRALQRLLVHHEGLRTQFRTEGESPMQFVTEPKLELQEINLSAAQNTNDQVHAFIQAESRRPIELREGPPFRALLLKLSSTEHILGLNYHHIVADLWGEALLYRDLADLYTGALHDTIPAVAHQASLIQLARLESNDRDSSLEQKCRQYWQQQLEGCVAYLQLPLDKQRPSKATFKGRACEVALEEALVDKLGRYAEENTIPLDRVIFAIWGYLLHRYSGQETLIVGFPINTRNERQENTVGYLSALLPIRFDFPDSVTLDSLLSTLRARLAAASEHAHLPFDKLVDSVVTERHTSRMPLVQAVFVPPVDGTDMPRLQGLSVSIVEHDPGRALFELGLAVTHTNGVVKLRLDYQSQCWEASSASHMLKHLRNLLEHALHEPGSPLSQAKLLSFQEEQRVLDQSTPFTIEPTRRDLIAAIEHSVSRFPDAEAIRCEGRSLTYAELDKKSDLIADRLHDLGVRPGDRVLLLVERSERAVAGILAILKIGGTYVPIDPRWPAQRVNFVLSDCAPAAAIVDGAARTAVDFGSVPHLDMDSDSLQSTSCARKRMPIIVPSDQVAYIIYTSGSTGKPKGVEVTHRNVLRLFAACRKLFSFSKNDRWSLFHSFAFDFSVWEMWGALLHGGCVVIVPWLESRSPDSFRTLLAEERITVLSQTPTAFRLLDAADKQASGKPLYLRYIVFGGEGLPFPILRDWFHRHGDHEPTLVNMYGITETTVHVSFRKVSASDTNTAAQLIGRPLPDLECLILDSRGHIQPVGIPGEICVGGAGLARGYYRQPDLTEERFISHPYRTGQRLYRSGDLGRWTNSGELEYLGRLDNQVQLRGFRIELGEIEAALTEVLRPEACHVMLREDDGTPKLIAYLVDHGGIELSLAEVRRRLGTRLPEYMLPSAIMYISALTLTVNGKVDSKALPISRCSDDSKSTSARTDVGTCQILCEIFEQVLGVDKIEEDDNFFQIGGNSMFAVQLAARSVEMGLELSVADVFVHQTPRALATLVENRGAPHASIAHEASEPNTQLSCPRPPICLPDNVEEVYPMAALQLAMLLAGNKFGSHVYHDVFRCTIYARWDENAFRDAVRELTECHPILRTSFHLEDEVGPQQHVHRSVEFPITVQDLRSMSGEDQRQHLAAQMRAEHNLPLDRQLPPVARMVVLQTAESHFQWLMSFHHALLDGWSVAQLESELGTLYNRHLTKRATMPHSPPKVTYRDFIKLEQETLCGPSLQWWRERLAGARAACFRKKRYGAQLAVRWTTLSQEMTRKLQSCADAQKVPLKSLLLAAHVAVVAVLARSGEVTTGIVTNGRPEVSDSQRVLGLFLNTVPLRVSLHGLSLSNLARQVFLSESVMMAHRRLPLRVIQRECGVGPLFDTVFNYVKFDGGNKLITQRTPIVREQLVEHTEYPFVVVFSQEKSELGFGIEYDPQIINEELDSIVGCYMDFLVQLAEGGNAAAYELHRYADSLPCLLEISDDVIIAERLADKSREMSSVRRKLHSVWENVLGYPIDTTLSLCDNGGDSIDALVLSERIAKVFDCKPPLQVLLQGATVETLLYSDALFNPITNP
ncbi:amino acid adenylation domain-containing protein [Caballeronia sp. EK]|uniref:non-ribosomal peptide synthetase n=1 Tax=Caballeronia sp. EK TaxID=2767469 RepID=UPI001654E676|nr:non-ribosomal peptide synthetase [Caballeronia sp. EK]MBC8643003.1 amino acid adenylation domain-containing protein [Caballeronia sp. EK]